MRSVLSEVIATLRERVGEVIDVKMRDSLRVAVHDKADAIERTVESARRRADAKRVDQAILARVFGGEL